MTHYVSRKTAKEPRKSIARKYQVIIQAQDGTYTKTYATLAAARAQAEEQIGRTLESQYDFQYNDGRDDGSFRALQLDTLFSDSNRAARGLSFIDDWGRRITLRTADTAVITLAAWELKQVTGDAVLLADPVFGGTNADYRNAIVDSAAEAHIKIAALRVFDDEEEMYA